IPRAEKIWYELGLAFYELDEKEKARDALERVIQINPYNLDAIIALADISNALEKYEEALYYCNLALNISEFTAEIYFQAALAYNGLNDKKTAILFLKEGVHINPHDPRFDLRARILLDKIKSKTEEYELKLNDLGKWKLKIYTCYYCGTIIDRNKTICSKCNKKILKCNVCKLPISLGEKIAQCPMCLSKNHQIHLQEWVKTQGFCPNCLQKLSNNDVIIL
ncbi:MAG: tetratricopeptide repeat protein, partial [Candidatus Heimdallarchaeota archaeon]|nr:tetratricopeptide repeat protein [Candidatus Heimdallarchaeota archaeon]